ncbi:hypothetical protein BDB00DRAFT_184395 [Zychaea mexicana]|uniref:uncharacterized protein n=1 Tax=Zychaea mexicana TaxID=64656 RepID=UPI0022FED7EE|nr:uncharacterized protein BDB00DRAFT_184395 [Zychaea mexicana]KAI9479482.1 hypothetical protein BDB00DRAFT_184395 [Zychaea mexicana]
MTVREQEDSRYSLGTGIANVPSVKHEEFMAPMQSPRPRRGGGGGGIRGGRGGRGRGNSNFGPRDIRDVSVNPNFMRNDGGDIVVPQKRQSEGPPAVPYLLAELAESIEAGTVEMPDYLTRRGKQQQQQQKNQFGPPGSFLDLYWTVDKQLREGKQGDDDGKVLAYRNNKWQRIKKEFDGRMEQQHSVTRGS